MELETAVNFLGCSILISIGFLILLAAIIAGNNMVAVWWKSWGWSWIPHWAQEPSRFMTQEEADRVAPHLEDEKKSDSNK